MPNTNPTDTHIDFNRLQQIYGLIPPANRAAMSRYHLSLTLGNTYGNNQAFFVTLTLSLWLISCVLYFYLGKYSYDTFCVDDDGHYLSPECDLSCREWDTRAAFKFKQLFPVWPRRPECFTHSACEAYNFDEDYQKTRRLYDNPPPPLPDDNSRCEFFYSRDQRCSIPGLEQGQIGCLSYEDWTDDSGCQQDFVGNIAIIMVAAAILPTLIAITISRYCFMSYTRQYLNEPKAREQDELARVLNNKDILLEHKRDYLKRSEISATQFIQLHDQYEQAFLELLKHPWMHDLYPLWKNDTIIICYDENERNHVVIAIPYQVPLFTVNLDNVNQDTFQFLFYPGMPAIYFDQLNPQPTKKLKPRLTATQIDGIDKKWIAKLTDLYQNSEKTTFTTAILNYIGHNLHAIELILRTAQKDLSVLLSNTDTQDNPRVDTQPTDLKNSWKTLATLFKTIEIINELLAAQIKNISGDFETSTDLDIFAQSVILAIDLQGTIAQLTATKKTIIEMIVKQTNNHTSHISIDIPEKPRKSNSCFGLFNKTQDRSPIYDDVEMIDYNNHGGDRDDSPLMPIHESTQDRSPIYDDVEMIDYNNHGGDRDDSPLMPIHESTKVNHKTR